MFQFNSLSKSPVSATTTVIDLSCSRAIVEDPYNKIKQDHLKSFNIKTFLIREPTGLFFDPNNSTQLQNMMLVEDKNRLTELTIEQWMLYKRSAEKLVRKGAERERRPFNVSSEAKKEDRPMVYLKGNVFQYQEVDRPQTAVRRLSEQKRNWSPEID